MEQKFTDSIPLHDLNKSFKVEIQAFIITLIELLINS